jgi:hypothetical protein
LEDDLNFFANRRRPKFFWQWKTNSIISQIGRQPQYLGNDRQPALFVKMEDDLNFKVNGRRPQCVGKWKTTSICWQLEDALHFCQMEDNHHFLCFKWKTTTVKDKANLASPSFYRVWHSSAPACLFYNVIEFFLLFCYVLIILHLVIQSLYL